MSADPLADAVYTLGTSDNDFNTALGGSVSKEGRFYPEGFYNFDEVSGVPDDTAPEKPYATYRIITMANNDQFRSNIERALIQIKVYSDNNSASEADSIIEKAKQLFHKTALTVTGYVGVKTFRENLVPTYREGDFWTSSIDFRTLIQET